MVCSLTLLICVLWKLLLTYQTTMVKLSNWCKLVELVKLIWWNTHISIFDHFLVFTWVDYMVDHKLSLLQLIKLCSKPNGRHQQFITKLKISLPFLFPNTFTFMYKSLTTPIRNCEASVCPPTQASLEKSNSMKYDRNEKLLVNCPRVRKQHSSQATVSPGQEEMAAQWRPRWLKLKWGTNHIG